MKHYLSMPLSVLVLALCASPVYAAQKSAVADSAHNLSSSGPGAVTSPDTNRVCVFCHTPHGSTMDGTTPTPLWNRTITDGGYTLYDDATVDDPSVGSSIQSTITQPEGSSKLCLSCHDGTIAIGKVNIIRINVDATSINPTLAMSGTAGDGTMPAGDGIKTGFTRDLGTDLRNDHPISMTYDSSWVGTGATKDAEFYDPASAAHIGNKVPLSVSANLLIPLESKKVQCTSCHDPHVIDDTVNNKFVREGLNRFQALGTEPVNGSFTTGSDILCLGCHKKEGWGASPTMPASVHGNMTVADETYVPGVGNAADKRDFPDNLPVYRAACLNCHDTHTVQGARKLLREGADTSTTPQTPAQEETCYQCHDGTTAVLNTAIANIKSDFTGSNKRMPIAQADTPLGSGTYEAHVITDADFTESPTQLGQTAANRHVECTDCHNPHRMIREPQFDGGGDILKDQGTHDHNPTTGGHTNEASGVLSGTTGVEPNYGACGTTATWDTCTITSYTELKGPASGGAGVAVTKEYQVCLKCHSDYAYSTPPFLGDSSNGTPTGTNNMSQYTDQAFEFQASDTGETSGTHTSFHPVRLATGRDEATRSMNVNNFTPPWNKTNANGGVGAQTMYCTDCHGSETVMSTTYQASTSEPTGSNPWGPHGSANDFILKGNWELDGAQVQGEGTTNSVSLCFRCHDYDAYSNVANNNATDVLNYTSGFSSSVSGTASAAAGANCQIDATVDNNNLHLGHRGILAKDLRCNWCHVAVPHGWRNKALLVDVVGDNACAGFGNAVPCDEPPYYVNAMLGGNKAGVDGSLYSGVNFKTSGNWNHSDCGGADMGGGMNPGEMWMNTNCTNPP